MGDMNISIGSMVLIAVLLILVGAAVGIFISNYITKLKQGAANRSAKKIISDAEKEADHLLRDARVSAKAETIKMREECENELRDRRREQSNVEKRLAQREELLDNRADKMDEKIKAVEKQEHETTLLRERLTAREQELAKNISRQIDELERIA